MVIKLLRLFPAYRALEADLDASANARIRAEDDARLWRSRADSAESERDKARASLEHSLKCVANYEAQRNGCLVVPFPDVFVALPQPEESEEQPGPRRRTMRDVQAEVRAQASKEAADRRRALAVQMENAAI